MLRIKEFINVINGLRVLLWSRIYRTGVCENLVRLGIAVNLIEKLPQVLRARISRCRVHVLHHLKKKGFTLFLALSKAIDTRLSTLQTE
jgi:hypothetical protein